jgi:hypothetical protein
MKPSAKSRLQYGCRNRTPATEPEPSVFPVFCSSFLSGGTRIRTGGTMILSRRPYVPIRSTVSTKSTLLQSFLGFAEEGLSGAY